MAKWLISYVAVSSLIGLSMANCTSVDLKRKGNLTCKDKRKIVNVHNKLRQKVATGNESGQSSAIYMLKMSWDEDLAKSAQNWAENCTFKHDTYEDRKDSRFAVGQNMAMSWSHPNESDSKDKPEFPKQIRSWYDEVSLYQGYFTFQVGHYTQVVWADTYLVGCGYVYYKDNDKYTKLYVCNYGPAGNMQGEQPYMSGQKNCSYVNLTSSTTSKSPQLCRPSNYTELRCKKERRRK